MTIKNWPPDERPREKLLGHGGMVLSDAELLAIFIGSGCGGQDAVTLARGWLQQFGSLQGLLRAPAAVLQQLPGVGPARLALVLAAAELGRRCVLAQYCGQGEPVSLEQAAMMFSIHLARSGKETLAVLFLDSHHAALALENIAVGTLDRVTVYPRELLRRALMLNAGAVIFGHNHPSGDPQPSAADVRVTFVLEEALAVAGIKLVDHLVVGGGQWVSIAATGQWRPLTE